MKNILEISQVNFSYGSVKALKDVSLVVPERKVVCVMGRNGVGKTTLMKTIMGVNTHSKGDMLFAGKNINPLPSYERVKSGLGYVPQGRMIFPKLSVHENLLMGLFGNSDKKNKIVSEEIYTLFPILKEMGKRMGGDLSGGQQQQLAIARALMTDPKLLILDEPTEGIQPNIIQQIGEVLNHLVKNRGITVLIVEQYLDFVREYCQEFYLMNRGSVVIGGPTTELKEELIKKYLHV